MLKLIYLTGFLLFCDISKVNTLECYTCVDCSTVDAKTPVETCGATATSTTTTTSTSTTSTTSSSTNPSTSSTTTSSSSASASTQSTTPSTTLSTTPSTTPSTTSTTPSTGASSSSSDTPGNSDPINPPPNETADENEEFIDNFRVIRARRDIMRAESRVDYVCLTLSMKVNNTDRYSRGCVAKPGNDDVCKAILQETPNITCTSCNTDKCNSASSLHTSLFFIFIVTVAKFALE